MKKVLTFCDVCEKTFSGESIEFYFNGTPMDICGSHCFHRFWAKQYDKAKQNKSSIRAHTGIELIEGKRRQA
jgi:hypothetical protein